MSALTLSDEMTATTPCRSHDPETWFSEAADVIAHAQALCRTCPLMTACLAGALERREPWGVWGGELFERGAIVARKRPKGRPRKDDGAAAAAAAEALHARLAEVQDELTEELGLALAVVPSPRRGAAVRPAASPQLPDRDGAAA